MVKYSFIVPVYNCEAYLKECVESILCQSGDYSLEVILVDDGAQDSSGQIADELAEKHPQVRAFHKENGGAASARNYGLREARGKYVVFVDGDDTLEENYLWACDALLKEKQADLMVLAMSFDYYKDGKLLRSTILGHPDESVQQRDVWTAGLMDLFVNNCLSSVCSKVFRMDRILESDLRFDENLELYEDLNFVIRYLRLAKEIVLRPIGCYHYRIHLDSNRYYSRISKTERINYLLSELHAGLQGLENPESVMIEANILNQVLTETFWGLITSPVLFHRKAIEFCDMTEFQRIYDEVTRLGKENSRVFNNVYKRQYIRLWCWITYRVMRRNVVDFVKKMVK